MLGHCIHALDRPVSPWDRDLSDFFHRNTACRRRPELLFSGFFLLCDTAVLRLRYIPVDYVTIEWKTVAQVDK